MNRCKICGNEDGNRHHTAREMMFGFRDQFTYLECGRCGCLQLVDIPADMGKYYPSNYYSFSHNGWLKRFLRNQWAAHAYRGGNLIGGLVWHLFGPHDAMISLRRVNLPRRARILDVGCGSGQLLLDMQHVGFQSLMGLDPYLDQDLVYANGVTVFKKQLAEMQGSFDVIMLHHSFEHLDQPAEVMRQLARLLEPDGRVIIRIPIADSYAWRHYGVNWMHMDPPRHLFLHTRKSIDLLAEQSSLKVETMICEGNESQFLGSEQYQRDIPLSDPRSFTASHLRRWMNMRVIRRRRAESEELNRKQEGDWGCFCLRKTS